MRNSKWGLAGVSPVGKGPPVTKFDELIGIYLELQVTMYMWNSEIISNLHYLGDLMMEDMAQVVVIWRFSHVATCRLSVVKPTHHNWVQDRFICQFLILTLTLPLSLTLIVVSLNMWYKTRGSFLHGQLFHKPTKIFTHVQIRGGVWALQNLAFKWSICK